MATYQTVMTTALSTGCEMSRRLKPTSDQADIIESIADDASGGTLFAGQMGVGKTLVATEVVYRLAARRVLIVCPKSTVGFADKESDEYDGWIGTFATQYPGMKPHVIKKRSDVVPGDGLFIIGREMVAAITKDTKKEPGVNWSKVQPYDVVVYDEIHFIGNRKSKAFKASMTLPAKKRVGLSGTPFRTKFDYAWAVCRFLWPNDNESVSKSYWTWRYQYCAVETQVFGQQRVERVVGEKNSGEFFGQLPSYHRLTAKKRAVTKRLYVELSPAQRRAYREMEDMAVAWLNDREEPLVASLPLVKRIRLREMTLGLPSVDNSTGTPILTFEDDCASSKLAALDDFLIGHEGQLLVFTHSQKFAVVAAKRLNAAIWTGKSSDSERAEAKRQFLAGEKQILVATPRSFGTGTDGLQHVCDTMVFLSRDSDTDNIQAIARLDRTGQKSPNVSVIDIVARDTYDEGDLSKEARSVLAMHKSLRDN